MHDFLTQYGVEAVEIPVDNFHVLDKTKFTEEELKKLQKHVGTENGFYSYQKSELEAADLTLKNKDKSASMNIRRSGFSIGTMDGKRLLFQKLNESVITELEI